MEQIDRTSNYQRSQNAKPPKQKHELNRGTIPQTSCEGCRGRDQIIAALAAEIDRLEGRHERAQKID